MSGSFEPLAGIVTTDLAAITRGRFVAQSRLAQIAQTGVGWIQANLALTAFSTVANPNMWGSGGDLRLVPHLNARSRSQSTGGQTPFDMIMGNLVEIDGSVWSWCTRSILREPAA